MTYGLFIFIGAEFGVLFFLILRTMRDVSEVQDREMYFVHKIDSLEKQLNELRTEVDKLNDKFVILKA